MDRRLIFSLVSILSLGAAGGGQAEPPAMVYRTVIDAVRLAAAEASFSEVDPELSSTLDQSLSVLEASPTAERPSLADLARWKPSRFRELGGYDLVGEQKALEIVRDIANNDLKDALDEAVGRDRRREILQPLTDLHEETLSAALAESLERIRRYEVKFGPDSARLNLLEVGLNFAIQGVPGFGPDDDGNPGPMEMLAAYSTTYLTEADEEAVMVSAAEFGLRCYFFARGWGQGGWMGYLKPNHVSAGVLVAGSDDGPLVSPWEGEERVGAFLAWGGLKVGWVGGDDERVLASREFQVVPWVF